MKSNQLVVINSGSSSIKFGVYEFDSKLNKSLNGQVENIKISPVLTMFDSNGSLIKKDTFPNDFGYEKFYEMIITAFETNEFNYTVSAVGHRVVHGGASYQTPVLVTTRIIEYLKELIPFAPLHQPYNIDAIEIISKSFPKLPQVACFDTAFHRTHPFVADCFGLPRSLTEAGITRYGFHGLSYEYIMHKFKEINPDKLNKRIIVAHLGNGASMCAIKDGKSIESTMGLTALDGLVMGTRCGNIDPGVILYLLEYKNMSAKEIEELLYKKSGLLGISGITSDMKTLLENSTNAAQDAIELFVYRIRRELGALVAALGGLDVLIFTGGIGEHAWQIREKVCINTDWLDMRINTELNRKNQTMISDAKSKVEIYVIPTNEEWIIASHTYHLIKKEI